VEQLTIGWLVLGFLIALVVTLILGRAFLHYALASVATPAGILDFELAGSAENARRMMTAWRATRSACPTKQRASFGPR